MKRRIQASLQDATLQQRRKRPHCIVVMVGVVLYLFTSAPPPQSHGCSASSTACSVSRPRFARGPVALWWSMRSGGGDEEDGEDSDDDEDSSDEDAEQQAENARLDAYIASLIATVPDDESATRTASSSSHVTALPLVVDQAKEKEMSSSLLSVDEPQPALVSSGALEEPAAQSEEASEEAPVQPHNVEQPQLIANDEEHVGVPVRQQSPTTMEAIPAEESTKFGPHVQASESNLSVTSTLASNVSPKENDSPVLESVSVVKLKSKTRRKREKKDVAMEQQVMDEAIEESESHLSATSTSASDVIAKDNDSPVLESVSVVKLKSKTRRKREKKDNQSPVATEQQDEAIEESESNLSATSTLASDVSPKDNDSPVLEPVSVVKLKTRRKKEKKDNVLETIISTSVQEESVNELPVLESKVMIKDSPARPKSTSPPRPKSVKRTTTKKRRVKQPLVVQQTSNETLPAAATNTSQATPTVVQRPQRPNALFRFLLHHGGYSSHVVLLLLRFSDLFIQTYLPTVAALLSWLYTLLPARWRLPPPPPPPRPQSRQERRQQQKLADVEAYWQLQQTTAEQAKYQHVSPGFRARHGLGVIDPLSQVVEDHDELRQRTTLRDQDIMKPTRKARRPAAPEEDWVVRAFQDAASQRKRRKGVTLSVGINLGAQNAPAANTVQRRRALLASVVDATQSRPTDQAPGASSSRARFSSDREGGGGLAGRIRAISGANTVSRSLFGAYPGDAVGLDQAAHPRGVLELARRYGYGEWSEDDDDDDAAPISTPLKRRRKKATSATAGGFATSTRNSTQSETSLRNIVKSRVSNKKGGHPNPTTRPMASQALSRRRDPILQTSASVRAKVAERINSPRKPDRVHKVAKDQDDRHSRDRRTSVSITADGVRERVSARRKRQNHEEL
jgi:hypothetical protein